MKKIFSKEIFFTLFFILTLFVSVNKVSADTYNINVLHVDNWYDNFDDVIADYSSHTSIYNNMVSLWQNQYSSVYPYYAIIWRPNTNYRVVDLIMSDNNSTKYTSATTNSVKVASSHYTIIRYSDNPNNSISYVDVTSSHAPILTSISDCDTFGCQYNSGNYLLFNNGFVMNNYTWTFEPDNGTHNEYNYYIEKIVFPSFNSSNFDFSTSVLEIETNDLLPSYLDLYNEDYDPDILRNYTEINLNNYDYVLLTLKDYTNTTEFWTRIYTLGKLCFTPVYNYGMTEIQDTLIGYKTKGCSEYYDVYTPVRVYIISSDIENHAVYYLKSSNTSIPNSVKVDNNIFNITYVTSANASNPSVTIGGRSYPVIPYNDLNDTAIISDENGYISGQLCAVGDTNCMYQNTGIDVDNLFTHPLQLLQSLWVNIGQFFAIVTAFMTVLPTELQTFLYVAFMLAVILGIIKIIL